MQLNTAWPSTQGLATHRASSLKVPWAFSTLLLILTLTSLWSPVQACTVTSLTLTAPFTEADIYIGAGDHTALVTINQGTCTYDLFSLALIYADTGDRFTDGLTDVVKSAVDASMTINTVDTLLDGLEFTLYAVGLIQEIADITTTALIRGVSNTFVLKFHTATCAQTFINPQFSSGTIIDLIPTHTVVVDDPVAKTFEFPSPSWIDIVSSELGVDCGGLDITFTCEDDIGGTLVCNDFITISATGMSMQTSDATKVYNSLPTPVGTSIYNVIVVIEMDDITLTSVPTLTRVYKVRVVPDCVITLIDYTHFETVYYAHLNVQNQVILFDFVYTPAWCMYDISLAIVHDTGLQTAIDAGDITLSVAADNSAIEFLITDFTNISLSTVYVMTMTLDVILQVGDPDSYTNSFTFGLEFTNDCGYSYFDQSTVPPSYPACATLTEVFVNDPATDVVAFDVDDGAQFQDLNEPACPSAPYTMTLVATHYSLNGSFITGTPPTWVYVDASDNLVVAPVEPTDPTTMAGDDGYYSFHYQVTGPEYATYSWSGLIHEGWCDVLVQKCVPDMAIVETNADSIEYTIGQTGAPVTWTDDGWTQSCNYGLITGVTWSDSNTDPTLDYPNWVTHSLTGTINVYTISTIDNLHAGVYYVTNAAATFDVDGVKEVAEVVTKITIKSACITATLSTKAGFSAQSLEISVLAGPAIMTLDDSDFEDDISGVYGADDYTFCGARSYEIEMLDSNGNVVTPLFLSQPLDNSFESDPQDNDDVDAYTCTLKVSLADYVDVATLDVPIVCEVTYCQVTNLDCSADLPLSVSFDFDNFDWVNYPSCVKTPDCDYTIDHTFFENVPRSTDITTTYGAFVTADDFLEWLEFEVADDEQDGSYTIYATATVNTDTFQTDTVDYDYEVDVTITTVCQLSDFYLPTGNTWDDPIYVPQLGSYTLPIQHEDLYSQLYPALTADGYSFCGDRTTVLTDNSNTWITENHTNDLDDMQLDFEPLMTTTVGSYYYDFSMSLTRVSTDQIALGNHLSVTSKEVIVTACEVTSITPVGSLSDWSQAVYDSGTLTQDVPTFTWTPACVGYTEVITSTIQKDTDPAVAVGVDYTFFSYDSTNPENFEYDGLATLTDVGTYTIVVTLSTAEDPLGTSEDLSFTLTITDPCPTTTINDTGMTNKGVLATWTMDVTVKGPALSETGLEMFYTLEDDRTDLVKSTLCGELTYSIVEAAALVSVSAGPQVDFTQATSDTLTASDEQYPTGHTYTFRACMTDAPYTTICGDVSFDLVIKPCELTNYVYDDTSCFGGSQNYIIGTLTAKQISLASCTMTQTPLCAYTDTTWTIAPNGGGSFTDGWIVADDANDRLTVDTKDVTLAGTYTIEVTNTIEADGGYYHDTTNGYSVTDSFSFELIDPCVGGITWDNQATPSAHINSGNNIQVSALGDPVTVTITAKDSASTALGDQDGLTLCGDRTYVVSGDAFDNNLVTLNDATQTAVTLKVQSKLLSHANHIPNSANTYSGNVNVCLDDYSPTHLACIDYTFTVQVNPCVVHTFTEATPTNLIQDQTHNIYTDAELVIAYPVINPVPKVPTTTELYCPYTQTYSHVISTDSGTTYDPFSTQQWIHADDAGTQYKIKSENIVDADTYTVKLTMILDDDYNEATGANDKAVTTNEQNVFDVTLVDSCLSTYINTDYDATFVSDTGYDVMAFSGHIQYPVRANIKEFPSVNWGYFDSIGTTYGNSTYGYQICGDYQYTVTIDDGSGAVAKITNDVEDTSVFQWFQYTKQVGNQPTAGNLAKLEMETQNFSDVRYVLDPSAPTTDVYAVSFQGCLADYAGQCETVSFNVEIQPCQITSYTLDGDETASEYIANGSVKFQYIVGQGELIIDHPETYTQTPDCQYTETWQLCVELACTTDPLPEHVSFALSPTMETTLETTNTFLAADYTWNLYVQLDDDYWADPTRDGANTRTQTEFSIEFVDPCLSTNVDANIAVDQASLDLVVTTVLGTAQTFDVTTWDSASSSYGDADGLTLCGARTYTLSGALTGQASTVPGGDITSIVGTTLTVYSTNPIDSDVAIFTYLSYTETLTVCLSDTRYADVTGRCSDITFDIEVWPCDIQSFLTDGATIPHQTTAAGTAYTILEDGPRYLTIPNFIQTPLCQYRQDYEFTVTPAIPYQSISDFIILHDSDPADLKFEINSDYILDEYDFYEIQLTVRLNNTDGTATYPEDFNTENLWQLTMINPCYTAFVNFQLFDLSGTTMSALIQEPQQMDTSVRRATPELQVLDYRDSVSTKYYTKYPYTDSSIWSDQTRICGLPSYTLTVDGHAVNPDWLTLEEDGSLSGYSNQITVTSTELEDEGYAASAYKVYIDAELPGYGVSASQKFIYINIEECFLTRFEIDGTQADQSHTIFDAQLDFDVNQYIQEPLCEYDLYFTAVIEGPNAFTNTTDITDNILDTTQDNQWFVMDNGYFDSTSRTMTDWSYPRYSIYANDFMLDGTYTVTQSVTIPTYKYTFPDSGQTHVDTNQWTLTMTDPCLTTTIDHAASSVFTDVSPDVDNPLMLTTVKFGTDLNGGAYIPVTYDFAYHTDDTSTTYSSTATVTDMFICRERTYTIQSVQRKNDAIDNSLATDYFYDLATLSPAFVGITADNLVGVDPQLWLGSIDQLHWGQYHVIMEVKLTHYPTITITENFWVTIESCKVKTLEVDCTVGVTLIQKFQESLDPAITFVPCVADDTEVVDYKFYEFLLYWTDGSQTLDLPTFIQTPLCDYLYSYEQFEMTDLDEDGVYIQDTPPSFSTFITDSDGVPTAFSFYSTDYNDDQCIYGKPDDINPIVRTDLTTCYDDDRNDYYIQLKVNLETTALGMEVHTDSLQYIEDINFRVWPHDECTSAQLYPMQINLFTHTESMFTFINQTYETVWEFKVTTDSVSRQNLESYDNDASKLSDGWDSTGLTYRQGTADDCFNYQDTAICSKAGYDLCGSRLYEVKAVSGADISSYAIVNQPKEIPHIRVRQVDFTEAGLRNINFWTSLSNTRYAALATPSALAIKFYYAKPKAAIERVYYQVNSAETPIVHEDFEIVPFNQFFTLQYTVHEYDLSTGVEFVDMPSYLTYDEGLKTIYVKTTDQSLIDEINPYIIRVRCTIKEYPDQYLDLVDPEPVYNDPNDADAVKRVKSPAYFLDFELIISANPPPRNVTDPPIFTSTLQSLHSFHYSTTDWEYFLPEIFDEDGDVPAVELVNLPTFVVWKKTELKFELSPAGVTQKDVGIYLFQLILSDSSDAESDPYVITIEVEDDPPPEVPDFIFDFQWAWQLLDPSLIVRPEPKVKKISHRGLIEIEWNTNIRRPRVIEYLYSGKVNYTHPDLSVTEEPILEVSVLAGVNSNKELLAYDWEITRWNGRFMDIQLIFDEPYEVSSNSDPEKLKIVFWGEQFFVTNDEYNVPIEGGPSSQNLIFELLPNQLPIIDAVTAQQLAETKQASQVASILNLIGNLALSASMNKLWSMINTQQLMVMIPLFQVLVPDNAAQFFNYIMAIAAFDIIETDGFYNFLLGLEDDDVPDALNLNFESVGFETIFFIHNLGSMGLFLLAWPILVVIEICLRPFKKNETLSRYQRNISKTIYWNYIIRILLESYMIVVVCALINAKFLDFSKTGISIVSVTALVFLVISIILPFAVYFFLKKNFHRLEDEDFKSKYGALAEGIDTSNPSSIVYQFYFIFRRLVMGITVVSLNEYLCFQVIGLVMSVIFAIVIVGNIYPLETKHANRMEFFNEMMIMCVMYTAITFSPWGPDIEVQIQLGYIAIAVVGTHIGVNLSIIFKETIHLQLLRYKRWKMWRKYAKIRSDKIYAHEKKLRHKKFKQEARAFKLRQKLREQERQREMQVNNMMGQSDLLKIGYQAQVLKKDAGEFSDISMSMDSDSVKDYDHVNVNEGLMKVPTEAPEVQKTKVSEFQTEALKANAQNTQLGSKQPPDYSLKQEQKINQQLGRTIPVDTIAPQNETIAIQEEKEEWKKASLADRLRRRHIEAPLPQLSETTVLHNKLANMPGHDFTMPKKRDALEQTMIAGQALADSNALRIAPDYNQIHGRLFTKQVAGDGSKPRNQYQLPPILDIQKQRKVLPKKNVMKQMQQKSDQQGKPSINMDPCQDIMVSTGKAQLFADMDKFLDDPNKTVYGGSKKASDTIKEAESFLQELSEKESRARSSASQAKRDPPLTAQDSLPLPTQDQGQTRNAGSHQGSRNGGVTQNRPMSNLLEVPRKDGQKPASAQNAREKQERGRQDLSDSFDEDDPMPYINPNGDL